MPKYFYRFASVITDNITELKDFIEGKSKQNQMVSYPKLSNEELMNFNPIKVIADNLVNLSIG